MAVRLNINVADISATLSAGYDQIKVYRSPVVDGSYSEITAEGHRIQLQSGVSSYSFDDGTGTTEHYYRTTFFDSSGSVSESALSDAFRGTFVDKKFPSATYPEEAVFTLGDRYTIDRIRNLIGDPKQLERDYVSSSTGYGSISVDEKTHSLGNPSGWPLKVVLDDTEYTTLDNPQVNDYKFLTFSGTTINTTSGTLDVWYYHFRNSDAEIMRAFNGLNVPPELSRDEVTFDLSAVCAAIELLEGELRLFGVDSGTEVDIFQEIRIDPSGGFTTRLEDLQALRRRKKEMIDAILAGRDGVNQDIDGVLID